MIEPKDMSVEALAKVLHDADQDYLIANMKPAPHRTEWTGGVGPGPDEWRAMARAALPPPGAPEVAT